ncbi:hypothetical protein CASFOL_027735 [Castilleja foliolosa]|uniref:Uncharacterized protein n=1 Tax=Castilleja foliolosa TaxID=1961234 RepID=A0ABD3CHB9_9LAMI
MAFLLNKTAISALRLRSQKAASSIILPRRGLHDEPGARKKTFSADDPELKRLEAKMNNAFRRLSRLEFLFYSMLAVRFWGNYSIEKRRKAREKERISREKGRIEKSD